MGQFSWYTQDTGEQIYNDWDKYGDKQTIHMVDPRDGTDYKEEGYEGYGMFGGRDFYELLVDINKDIIEKYCGQMLESFIGIDHDEIMNKNYKELTEKELDKKRSLGIDIWFSFMEPDPFSRRKLPDDVEILSPILVSNYDLWERYKGSYPESDPDQGWHCLEDEDEDDD